MATSTDPAADGPGGGGGSGMNEEVAGGPIGGGGATAGARMGPWWGVGWGSSMAEVSKDIYI